MRRLFLALLLLVFLLLPLGLGLAAWLALEPAPRVAAAAVLTHQDIERARRIIAQNNPYRLRAGALHILNLTEKDLTLAANYLINNTASGSAVIKLLPGQLRLQATILLPENPLNPYLNLQLTILETREAASIARLQIGRLPIPGYLADFMLAEAMRYLLRSEDGQLIRQTIRRLRFSKGRLQLLYRWRPELIAKLRAHLISPQDEARIRSYYRKMAELTRQPGLKQRASVIYLLRPLFAYARQRSQNGDPVAENRAALTVLADYILPGAFNLLMPGRSDLPPPRRLVLTLDQRKDFAEHFIGSAALAATGNTRLADAVGLYKEVADSRGQSGFSFTDLAADRAGTRFGELATRSPRHARRVQRLLAGGAAETDLMPRVDDLPEHLSTDEFRRRFGRIGSPAFHAIRQRIEQRIAACRLYREAD